MYVQLKTQIVPHFYYSKVGITNDIPTSLSLTVYPSPLCIYYPKCHGRCCNADPKDNNTLQYDMYSKPGSQM